ncbi:MAG: aldo/keto reductase, partial [Lachnospiraceae bacterium]|nr:aldo/keto reductase [Lachnospiraceae bacterium]
MKKLGFGTMRLPLTDPEDEKSIDYDQMCQMVDHFLKQGFVYFDTAYMYHKGLSEDAVKRCLVDRYPREQYILADKMPIQHVKASEEYPKYFEEQLRR